MRDERASESALELRHSLEMRYAGQDFAMPVPVEGRQLAGLDRLELACAFNALHQRAFGYHDPAQPLEIVSVRLAAFVRRADSPLILSTPNGERDGRALRPRAMRDVWFAPDRAAQCAVYQREQLSPGTRIDGPAVVQEYASTTLVGPGDRLEVTATGELLITVGPTS
jgi:N-methylhydantoinase A